MNMTDPDINSGPRSFVRFTRSMNGILNDVSRVLDNEAEPAEHRVKRAGALLRDYPRRLLEENPSSSTLSARPVRGGLLAWHIRRVKDHLDAHLAEPIRVQDMAALLGMSSSHFCRAFRASLEVLAALLSPAASNRSRPRLSC